MIELYLTLDAWDALLVAAALSLAVCPSYMVWAAWREWRAVRQLEAQWQAERGAAALCDEVFPTKRS